MAAGKSVGAKHQHDDVDIFVDVEAAVAYSSLDAEPGTGTVGELLFLHTAPNALQLWKNEKLVMIALLVASFVSLVLFAPLFRDTTLFLLAVAAVMAACLGVLAADIHLCEADLAESSTLELFAQVKMANCCCRVAWWLAAVLMTPLRLWKLTCDPTTDHCWAWVLVVGVFLLCCLQHGIVWWAVSARAHNIMQLLQPVSSVEIKVAQHKV